MRSLGAKMSIHWIIFPLEKKNIQWKNYPVEKNPVEENGPLINWDAKTGHRNYPKPQLLQQNPIGITDFRGKNYSRPFFYYFR